MQKQLDDGLVLRSLSEGHDSDRENVGKFFERVFGAEGDPDADRLTVWTNDLIADTHPTTTLDDIWVVVDTAKDDQIVSALLLIPQQWHYETIEMGVGRIELVATDADYRRRGLIRQLMNAAHERSEVLGHVMQSITGIPNYYRRFGYTMAVDLGGRAGLNFSAVPKLEDDESPKYTLRPATDDDIPHLVAWDVYQARRFMLSKQRTAEEWAYELNHRSEPSPPYCKTYIIVDADERPVGYMLLDWPHEPTPYGRIAGYVLGENASYLATFNDVIRGVEHIYRQYNEANTPEGEDPIQLMRFGFDSGIPPVVDQIVDSMSSGVARDRVYAWYLRVPDYPRFINHIKPVLEERLNHPESGVNGYTGELKIGFYDLTGLTMTFEAGKITDVACSNPAWHEADVSFQDLLFLNLLFGYQTVDELSEFMPEIYANTKARLLLNALFPCKRSWINPLA